MASFKQPDFIERQEAAAKARKVALEKFRAKAADPALAERLTARAARAAERSAIKTTREIGRAANEAREAERAHQAERDAAIEAERAKAESGERERALQAKQKAARDARYAARKSRPKRAGRFAHYMGHKNFLHGSNRFACDRVTLTYCKAVLAAQTVTRLPTPLRNRSYRFTCSAMRKV
jgi:hypothetical protein